MYKSLIAATAAIGFRADIGCPGRSRSRLRGRRRSRRVWDRGNSRQRAFSARSLCRSAATATARLLRPGGLRSAGLDPGLVRLLRAVSRLRPAHRLLCRAGGAPLFLPLRPYARPDRLSTLAETLIPTARRGNTLAVSIVSDLAFHLGGNNESARCFHWRRVVDDCEPCPWLLDSPLDWSDVRHVLPPQLGPVRNFSLRLFRMRYA